MLSRVETRATRFFNSPYRSLRKGPPSGVSQRSESLLQRKRLPVFDKDDRKSRFC